MTKQYDIIVIGSGLSGSAAALKAAESGRRVIALARPGEPGYWARVKRMHHVPGCSDDLSGADLVRRTREQAERCGAVFHEFGVTEIKPTEHRTYQVAGGNAESFEAPAVIIATGVSKDEHFLAGERELVGRGVFYSALNEAPSLKHGTVVIVGKSEETAIAVLHLTKFADKIFFVIPGSKLDVSENLLRMLEAERKIEPLFSSSIKKINGEEELHSVTVLSAGTEREIKAKAAFIYTYPLKPCSQFLKDAVETDKESGRILVNPEFSTSRPGIFACGDVLAGELQHPSISTAQGIVAAISAEKLF